MFRLALRFPQWNTPQSSTSEKGPLVAFDLRETPSYVTTFWCESHRQAGEDFRARWRRCAAWVFAIFWLTGLLGSLGVISYLTTPKAYSSGTACQPDGSFSLDAKSFWYWSNSGFFQITLGFGTLSFTQAKAIDIIWDVVSTCIHTNSAIV